MGDLRDNNNEDDELFDIFMLNEMSKDSGSKSGGSGGGCLTCMLLMIGVPVAFIIGVASLIV